MINLLPFEKVRTKDFEKVSKGFKICIQPNYANFCQLGAWNKILRKWFQLFLLISQTKNLLLIWEIQGNVKIGIFKCMYMHPNTVHTLYSDVSIT